jgi:hypothetical protein
MEMNLQKIESVDVDQSLIGRIFDYGAVTIRGVGSSYEPLRLIDAPRKLRSTVTAGFFGLRKRAGRSVASAEGEHAEA